MVTGITNPQGPTILHPLTSPNRFQPNARGGTRGRARAVAQRNTGQMRGASGFDRQHAIDVVCIHDRMGRPGAEDGYGLARHQRRAEIEIAGILAVAALRSARQKKVASRQQRHGQAGARQGLACFNAARRELALVLVWHTPLPRLSPIRSAVVLSVKRASACAS